MLKPNNERLFMRHFTHSRKWTFAKTFAKTAPHWYTVRNYEPGLQKEFETAVKLGRVYGYDKKWGKTVYKYFDFEGFTYWTMGSPVSETTIINRILIDPDAGWYHTALKKTWHYAGLPSQHFISEDDRAEAFCHDITKGPLPEQYAACDFIYSEPSWRAAFPDSGSYKIFLAAIRGIIRADNRPKIIMTGRHALASFPTPTITKEIKLNGGSAIVTGYGDEVVRLFDVEDARSIIENAASVFDRVGDFCCGYGRTARIFTRAGKKSVSSDIDQTSIGYIEDHYPAWRKKT